MHFDFPARFIRAALGALLTIAVGAIAPHLSEGFLQGRIVFFAENTTQIGAFRGEQAGIDPPLRSQARA